MNKNKSILPVIEHHIPAPDVPEPSPYGITHQGTATNSFTKIKPLPGENMTLDLYGNATIKEHGMTLLIAGFNDLIKNISVSTKKLLDIFTMTLTENVSQSSLVRIALDDYMNMCGLKDKKEARRQINADMEALSRLKLSWREKEKGKAKDFIDIFLFGGEKGIRNGVIYFSFSQTFFTVLKNYPTMPYHRVLFQVHPKHNPYSFNIGRLMQEHKRMNAGKKNENRIAVATLLKNCPGMPSYEKVINTNREVTGRIIEPFERDLNALNEMITWEYCHRNGNPLTDDELKNFSYSTFIKCLINISWKEYPDQTPLIEARAARNKANTCRRKKATHKEKTV